MRPWPFLLLMTGCSPTAPPPAPPKSPCHDERFESTAFTVCEPGRGKIEIHSGYRSFAALQAALGERAGNVAFAMNAGMFDDAGKPVGLMVEKGREVHAINRRKGFGNFHLMPNGVFLVRDNGAVEAVTSDRVGPTPTIEYATQSGPMLLIGGQMNPRIDRDGASHFVRNAVGIDYKGGAHFVISLDAVSFGKLARFMRERVGVRDALYFDGSVSSLWDPVDNRMDAFADLGPMVVVFKPAESGRRRATRATP
ncbi:MAG: phosphodiester glycosidase family protein [Sphingomonas sp.]|uniref:phosphodiester glycosidase family protein n=1 Tax=Sphingomonas sp. TaxID=28214 RepID=UPI0017F25BF9|nr:phosphodiester glycosidase family protein [Sphingomonas sp.]MBA3666234.1 phosphodiester glycosidase family protein [Sphingomonas sp.]